MTMVPLGGVVSSAAGAPLSRTAGSEAERVQKENIAHARQTETNQQAKFYRLTAAGKKQLVRERDRWSQLVAAISGVLDADPAKG